MLRSTPHFLARGARKEAAAASNKREALLLKSSSSVSLSFSFSPGEFSRPWTDSFVLDKGRIFCQQLRNVFLLIRFFHSPTFGTERYFLLLKVNNGALKAAIFLHLNFMEHELAFRFPPTQRRFLPKIHLSSRNLLPPPSLPPSSSFQGSNPGVLVPSSSSQGKIHFKTFSLHHEGARPRDTKHRSSLPPSPFSPRNEAKSSFLRPTKKSVPEFLARVLGWSPYHQTLIKTRRRQRQTSKDGKSLRMLYLPTIALREK